MTRRPHFDRDLPDPADDLAPWDHDDCARKGCGDNGTGICYRCGTYLLDHADISAPTPRPETNR